MISNYFPLDLQEIACRSVTELYLMVFPWILKMAGQYTVCSGYGIKFINEDHASSYLTGKKVLGFFLLSIMWVILVWASMVNLTTL